MVGSSHTIQCTINTVSGVTLDSVKVNWIGPSGTSITNNSRIMIPPLTFSGNNYTSSFISSLQFMYLMEGDEGSYLCNVSILQRNEAIAFQLSGLQSKQYIALM